MLHGEICNFLIYAFCSDIRVIYMYYIPVIYICMFPAFVREHVWHKAFKMGYSMRLELTPVSSMNDSCLVEFVFIRVFVPPFWSMFTLVFFTLL